MFHLTPILAIYTIIQHSSFSENKMTLFIINIKQFTHNKSSIKRLIFELN